MEDKKQHIEKLFRRYLTNKCTPDEISALLQHFDVDENEESLRSLIRKELDVIEDAPLITDEASKTLLNTVFEKIKWAITHNNTASQARVVSFYRRSWFRIGAAAILILMVSATAFYILNRKDERVIAKNETNIRPAKDIPPGTDNAVLTLDDGSTIVLDSAANGILAQQGSMKVLKQNGQISYKAANGKLNTEPIYNTITTANGNEYRLTLADGSKVWLNAASSIRFPTFFGGNERKVEITGEAYFEVTHNASKPFKVAFKNRAEETGEIEVLGTHFNVNAYDDENEVKTTLLEGSVKIKGADQVKMLAPGQQAVLTTNKITLKKDVDISQVIAWKDGFFVFNNTDLQMIMKQVTRWYNVQVNFEGKINEDGYSGKISRNVPLSKFLKVLELNGVRVKIEGRRITIL